MKRIIFFLVATLSTSVWAVFPTVPACAGEEKASFDVPGLTAALMGKHKKQVISLIGSPDKMIDSHLEESGGIVGSGEEARNIHESGLWLYRKPVFLSRQNAQGNPSPEELRIWFDMDDRVSKISFQ